MTEPLFDTELIRRYDHHGPRYTSYPTAAEFHDGFAETGYREQARLSNDDLIPKPLSLYLHIPFCRSLCYYCACNKKITQHAEDAVPYLAALHNEIAIQSALFDPDRPVIQLHLGGGTPTFLSDAQLESLIGHIGQHFTLRHRGIREWSVEIDPRTVTPERISALAGMGFNRLSMGIQDFHPPVQRAVNRIQSPAEVAGLVNEARHWGFQSISFDLIYGLPLQTPASFEQTLQKVVAMSPDRISVYNYAHLPDRFRAQRLIDAADLPSAAEKLRLLELSVNYLCDAGYEYIGMDHFAMPDDSLSKARRSGHLHRNFQGYSTLAECDLIGMGASAISHVGDCYVQNVKETKPYTAQLTAGYLPTTRGLLLSEDDKVRAYAIHSVMCRGLLRYAELSKRFDIDPTVYFEREQPRLAELQRDGLIDLAPDRLEVTAKGRFLLRTIAMAFDAYRRPDQKLFSKAI